MRPDQNSALNQKQGGYADKAEKLERSEIGHFVGTHVADRLYEMHGEKKRRLFDGRSVTLCREDLNEITEAFMLSEPGEFMSALSRVGLDDLDFARFYRQVIGPVADVLGEMWCDDRANFLGVSVAIERLRLTVDTLYPDEAFDAVAANRQVLLTCLKGDTHTFGAFLLSKAFLMHGWHVVHAQDHDITGSPLSRLKRDRYDTFGISVADEEAVEACASLIERARAVSANPDLVIGVGGSAITRKPERYLQVGADFVVADAVDAVMEANLHIDRSLDVAKIF